MQPQFLLRIAGIAALVIAALFAVLAVHYYLTQHIREVMDDLSGKTRARGVAGVRRASSDSRRSGAQHPSHPLPVADTPVAAPAASEQPRQATVAPAPDPIAMAFADEEEGGTVLVEALHAEPATPVNTPSDASAKAPAATPSFRVTRRIVLIHSPEVIATSEEPLV